MLVVPARPGDLDGEEEHAQVVSARLGLGVKGAHGPFQIVVTGREPLGDKARPPRQEELNRTRLSCQRSRRQCRGHRKQPVASPGDDGSVEGSQERFLGQSGVEHLQMSGGGQKEPCALVATPFEVRHPASQSFDASERKLVGLGRLDERHELQRRVRRASLVFRLGRSQSAFGLAGRVEAQGDGALQEGSRRCRAPRDRALSAERSSSSATASSGPGAAWA